MAPSKTSEAYTIDADYGVRIALIEQREIRNERDFDELKGSIKEEFQSVKADIKEGFSHITESISSLSKDNSQRCDTIESKILALNTENTKISLRTKGLYAAASAIILIVLAGVAKVLFGV